MVQEFKSRFYKKVHIKGKHGGERDIYLFKNYERFDKGKWKLVYISAYKSRRGEDFIAESGAGIPISRMNKQLKDYLIKWVD